jgi:GMP synthase (glutamine-hydrolysing)
MLKLRIIIKVCTRSLPAVIPRHSRNQIEIQFDILLGGQVSKSEHREYGHGTLTIQKSGRLFSKLPKKLKVWNSHGDRLIKLPPGFTAIGTTDNSEYAVIEDAKRNFYGIQFHPEVSHSERGTDVIRNFLVGVCKASQDWTTADFINKQAS